MTRAWFALRYYVSFLLFGLCALAVSGLCAPGLLVPHRERLAPAARHLIRLVLRAWVWWLRAIRIVDVRWTNIDPRTLPARAVYVANHPTLIDATVILPHLRQAICIFKAALLHNPIVAPGTLLAGYLASDRHDALRCAAAHVRAGHCLLVFPEGTRTTVGHRLNPLKPGFLVVARAARAPVVVLRLRASPALLPRGRPWWKLPRERLWIEITCDGILSPDELQDPRTAAQRVEERLRQQLAAMDS